MPRIGFLFLGGAHQVLHTAPVAAELAHAGCFITVFIASEEERAMFDRAWRAYGSPPVTVHQLKVPPWAKLVTGLIPSWNAMKIPRLLAARKLLASLDAVVTPEYTSTLLKRLPGPLPVLIHIPHGSGDRVRSIDGRLSLYDLVIVAGEKTCSRMIAEGVVRRDLIRVAGSPKLGAIERLAAADLPLFQNERPTVLYNPHFDSRVGSWERLGRSVMDCLAGSDEFNLMVAPHIRLFATSTPTQRAVVEASATSDHLHIDLGSAASSDMTYTSQADIYLGDVSSQVNEFAAKPRPCVFLNAHRVNWRDNPSYQFWRMGEVIDDIADLLPALHRARALFEFRYRDIQTEMTKSTFGADSAGAPRRAATMIMDFVAA